MSILPKIKDSIWNTPTSVIRQIYRAVLLDKSRLKDAISINLPTGSVFYVESDGTVLLTSIFDMQDEMRRVLKDYYEPRPKTIVP